MMKKFQKNLEYPQYSAVLDRFSLVNSVSRYVLRHFLLDFWLQANSIGNDLDLDDSISCGYIFTMIKTNIVVIKKYGSERVYKRSYEYQAATKSTKVIKDIYLGTFLGRFSDNTPAWINFRIIKSSGITTHIQTGNPGLLEWLCTKLVVEEDAKRWAKYFCSKIKMNAKPPTFIKRPEIKYLLSGAYRGAATTDVGITKDGNIIAGKLDENRDGENDRRVYLFDWQSMKKDPSLCRRAENGEFPLCIVTAGKVEKVPLKGFMKTPLPYDPLTTAYTYGIKAESETIQSLVWAKSVIPRLALAWEDCLKKAGFTTNATNADAWLFPGLSLLLTANYRLLGVVPKPTRAMLLNAPFLPMAQPTEKQPPPSEKPLPSVLKNPPLLRKRTIPF